MHHDAQLAKQARNDCLRFLEGTKEPERILVILKTLTIMSQRFLLHASSQLNLLSSSIAKHDDDVVRYGLLKDLLILNRSPQRMPADLLIQLIKATNPTSSDLILDQTLRLVNSLCNNKLFIQRLRKAQQHQHQVLHHQHAVSSYDIDEVLNRLEWIVLNRTSHAVLAASAMAKIDFDGSIVRPLLAKIRSFVIAGGSDSKQVDDLLKSFFVLGSSLEDCDSVEEVVVRCPDPVLALQNYLQVQRRHRKFRVQPDFLLSVFERLESSRKSAMAIPFIYELLHSVQEQQSSVNLGDVISDLGLNDWDLYRVSLLCMETRQYGLATRLLQRVSPKAESENTKFWVESLEQWARAENLLPFSSVSTVRQEQGPQQQVADLDEAIRKVHEAVASLQVLITTLRARRFQEAFLGLRLAFLQITKRCLSLSKACFRSKTASHSPSSTQSLSTPSSALTSVHHPRFKILLKKLVADLEHILKRYENVRWSFPDIDDESAMGIEACIVCCLGLGALLDRFPTGGDHEQRKDVASFARDSRLMLLKSASDTAETNTDAKHTSSRTKDRMNTLLRYILESDTLEYETAVDIIHQIMDVSSIVPIYFFVTEPAVSVQVKSQPSDDAPKDPKANDNRQSVMRITGVVNRRKSTNPRVKAGFREANVLIQVLKRYRPTIAYFGPDAGIPKVDTLKEFIVRAPIENDFFEAEALVGVPAHSVSREDANSMAPNGVQAGFDVQKQQMSAVVEELIFLGTGTSGCVPNVNCLTKPEPPYCTTCPLAVQYLHPREGISLEDVDDDYSDTEPVESSEEAGPNGGVTEAAQYRVSRLLAGLSEVKVKKRFNKNQRRNTSAVIRCTHSDGRKR
ncbi:Integrator complex subunit 7 [Quaeritorhiza haematococci]|nr:Integrator complex subunit 7 [Quaeritorhiza haematococci]